MLPVHVYLGLYFNADTSESDSINVEINIQNLQKHAIIFTIAIIVKCDIHLYS